MQLKKDKKYIHYCWFGNKPLPKLAKKCIKSWKKYLPDFEIIRWDENNTDINECPFVKEAYEKGKYAFVADYARTKAIYEYGGIYLDTDMKITRDISFLMENESFLGVEDSGAIAVGVWGAKGPHSALAKQMLDFYRAQKHFNSTNMYSIAIPRIITNILDNYGFQKDSTEVQTLSNGVVIYPREYFYPLSYDYHNNCFTKNTCMVHYYDASWTPKGEQKAIATIRRLGPTNAKRLFKIKSKTKALCKFYGKVAKRTITLPLYPLKVAVKKFSKKEKSFLQDKAEQIRATKSTYITITREDWLGVRSATEAVFDKVVTIPEIQGHSPANIINAIVDNNNLKTIFFSGFAKDWENIISAVKTNRPEIDIKVIWHGSNAVHTEHEDWDRFKKIFELINNGLINQIIFIKKSMYEQYKLLGYNVDFLPNNYMSRSKSKKRQKDDDRIRIGIYSSGTRWVKNFYNQLAAASLIKNAEIDVVPIPAQAYDFARILKISLEGEEESIPREKLLERINEADIVLYTSFVECAPILPLECLEQGTICITGDNHHYWTNTPLEKYLVEPKVDNPIAIADRINLCLKHKDEILKLYKEWKKEYDSYCKKAIEKILKNAK